MRRGIFINADKDKPVCSMYQRGLAAYEGFRQCKSASIEYLDAASDAELNIPYLNSLDFVILNYHPATMHGITHTTLSQIKVPIFAMVLEMTKHPLRFASHLDFSDIFSRILYLDPMLPELLGIWRMGRVVHPTTFQDRPVNFDRPIISTFGIPHIHKGILDMIVAINEEFDEAVFRLHYPPGSHLPYFAVGHIHSLLDQADEIRKPGIKIEFTDEFMSLERLLSWLNESDLNLFFFTKERDFEENRNIPSSVDDAISAKRPIAVNELDCLDYFLQYQRPYPELSLREAMQIGTVKTLYDLWSAANFATEFDAYLESYPWS